MSTEIRSGQPLITVCMILATTIWLKVLTRFLDLSAE